MNFLVLSAVLSVVTFICCVVTFLFLIWYGAVLSLHYEVAVLLRLG